MHNDYHFVSHEFVTGDDTKLSKRSKTHVCVVIGQFNNNTSTIENEEIQ